MARLFRFGGFIALAAAGAFAGWTMLHGVGNVDAANPPPAPPPVPVTTAMAKVQDVPILLEGLGTVQALNTVEIRAQVNGALVALPVKEGQEVHKGDVIAEIDPRPFQAALDQATAQKQAAQAQLQGAQLDLIRYQQLAKRNFAPVQQVDDQAATVNQLIATIAADTAAIETARINLGYCVVRAPIDGRVSLYQLDAGNLVQANTSNIVSITQDMPISVVFTLPENEFASVQAAMAHGPVPVTVSSNASNTKLATGTLLAPNNMIDTSTGTISLKATFKNHDDKLWPGEFVNTYVQVEVMRNALTVPTLAVEHGPNGLFAYIAEPDDTVRPVPVQIGYSDGQISVVTKGISPNATVVVSGQSRLAPGTHVNATPGEAPVAQTVVSAGNTSPT